MIEVDRMGDGGFSFLRVRLSPGGSITTEAGAMASMTAGLSFKARLNGGVVSAFVKRFLGGETLFVTDYVNDTAEPQSLYLTTPTPGEIKSLELSGGTINLEPGAFLCATPGVSLEARWVGFRSWPGGEGLFKLAVSGTGTVWFAGYGTILEREVTGETLVDTGHLVAYEPTIRIKLQFAGGLLSSLFGGEGLVMRTEGTGKIFIQTRSLGGLAAWANQRF